MNPIYNRYNFNPIRFQRKEEEKKPTMQNDEEKLKNLSKELNKRIIKHIEYDVPSYGRFSSQSVTYIVPNTNNKVGIIVEENPKDPKNSRWLRIAANRVGTDLVRSAYIFEGSKNEALDFVKKDSFAEDFNKLSKQLSDNLDKYIEEHK